MPATPDNAMHVDSVLREAARRWVVQLASGDLREEDLRVFKQWLAAHEDHRRAFRRANVAWQQVGPLRERMAQSLPLPGSAIRSARFARRAAFAGALAACLILFIALGNPLTWLRADHVTGVGEVAEVRLPDGSLAIMDTDSAIAVNFGTGERRIELLRGQVWFDVRPDTARPFRVQSGTETAEAVGTAFSVTRRDDAFQVRVTHGRVRVAAQGRDGAVLHEPQYVDAGLSLSRTERAAQSGIAGFDEKLELSWRDEFVVIDNTPLAQTLAELDRYRPGRILLLNDDRASAKISGSFRLDTIDGGIESLAHMQGLQVIRITPYLILLR